MKKKIVYLTTIFSTIALLSTGFAAWVISGNDSEEVTGNIAVDTVSDARRMISDFAWTDESYKSLTFAEGQTSPTIVFGGLETPKDNAWLTGGLEKGVENLTLHATFKVSNSTDKNGVFLGFADIFDSITITSDAKYETAKTANLVDILPYVTFKDGDTATSVLTEPESASNRNTKISINYMDGEYRMDIVFDWGSAFNHRNPYDHYNDYTAEEKGDEALTNLKELEKLTGAVYKLTITTKVGA